MAKEKRLGKGLAALLGTSSSDTGSSAGGEEADPSDRLLHLNVYDIEDNPFQPRRDFSDSEISSLAESLKEHEMLQPVLVRVVEGRYQLISGERRLRAAIQAGWDTIPARIREADDRLVAELAIVENLQRKDLNPVEKALSFKRYIEQHQCTQEDLAGRLKIDRSTIANLVRLLELPEVVLDSLRKGDISAGHARALLPLGEEDAQIQFSEKIRREKLSVRAVERMVSDLIRGEDGDATSVPGRPRPSRSHVRTDLVASLEQELRMALGAKVEIRQGSRGKGRIVVHFANHDEFDRLRQLLAPRPATGEQRAA